MPYKCTLIIVIIIILSWHFLLTEVLEVFKKLGSLGIDMNASLDTDGCSALITAITLDWPILVQLLIDMGADIHDEGMPKFGACISSDQAIIDGAGDHNPHHDQDR